MLVQLKSHAQATPVAWMAQRTSGTAQPQDAAHLIRFAVDNIPISVLVGNRPTGKADGQSFLVLESGQRTSEDGVTVSLTSPRLHESLEGIRSELGDHVIVTGAARLGRDPIIDGLARALVARDEVGQGLGSTYTNAVCAALVTRLVALSRTRGCPAPAGQTKAALPKWRLKRVVDYVDARLARRITLADMAASTGLTRMHFAAQFRLATGIRPHEYVLRRRIERAQELLRQSDRTLVDVALSVGFQTQAHFTTVFKRFAGQTPQRWRQAIVAIQMPARQAA